MVITEIGGTVGDIESLPFLEAIRQFALDVGRENCLYIHLTLVPYLKAAGELKTKPTQHSVGALRQIGIQPDVLICRTEHPIPPRTKDKIALFCNVERKAVIEERDKEFSIYEVPLSLVANGLDEILVKRLGLKTGPLDIADWRELVDRMRNPDHEVTIAVVGKYMKHRDAYKSVYESLDHAGIAHRARVRVRRVEAEELERPRGRGGPVAGSTACWSPAASACGGSRGRSRRSATRGRAASRSSASAWACSARPSSSPGACSAWRTPTAPSSTRRRQNPVIGLMEDQAHVRKRGGTMRLGAWPCELAPGAWRAQAYGADAIEERHRHRYEFNNAYRKRFEENGLVATGSSPDGALVEIIELTDHPWFLAVQFHPEFKSKPTRAHPLFRDFVAAALARREAGRAELEVR